METVTPADSRPSRFKLHSIQDVLDLPPLEWLIDGVLPIGGQAVLFGPSGEGKSFVALDMALSVGAGRPWLGHAVKRGPVIYVVAEGGRGTAQRIAAWRKAHLVEPDGGVVLFVLNAVQLIDDNDIEELLRQIVGANIRPSLIVIDTLARCFVGGEENSVKDVGQFVNGCDRLHRRTGAAVLVIHHTGKKKGGIERGSSALRGAADVMILHKKGPSGLITLSNDKQKDAEAFKPIKIRLRQVELDSHDANGNPVTSCVLDPTNAPAHGTDAALNAGQHTLLMALLGRDGDGMTARDWRDAVTTETGSEVAPRTFQNRRQGLVEAGLVEKVPGSNPPRYRLTEDGHARATGMPA